MAPYRAFFDERLARLERQLATESEEDRDTVDRLVTALASTSTTA
jgi:hypothetical protein